MDLRVHGSLNDFLPSARRHTTQRRPIDGRPAVKDVVEAAGVPHPEISLLLVNGEPADLARRLEPGDRVAAYPAGWSGVTPVPVPPAAAAPGGEARFILDGHLGRLAAYLRMCGFDTAYRRDAHDDELARVAASDDRILLTRDIGLLKRGAVRWGAFVRADRPAEQLVEVLARYHLATAVHAFARCLRCNGLLQPVESAEVRDAVPPRVLREQTTFRRCPDCGGIYWRGSHHARMTRLLERALTAARAGPRTDAGS